MLKKLLLTLAGVLSLGAISFGQTCPLPEYDDVVVPTLERGETDIRVLNPCPEGIVSYIVALCYLDYENVIKQHYSDALWDMRIEEQTYQDAVAGATQTFIDCYLQTGDCVACQTSFSNTVDSAYAIAQNNINVIEATYYNNLVQAVSDFYDCTENACDFYTYPGVNIVYNGCIELGPLPSMNFPLTADPIDFECDGLMDITCYNFIMDIHNDSVDTILQSYHGYQVWRSNELVIELINYLRALPPGMDTYDCFLAANDIIQIYHQATLDILDALQDYEGQLQALNTNTLTALEECCDDEQ